MSSVPRMSKSPWRRVSAGSLAESGASGASSASLPIASAAQPKPIAPKLPPQARLDDATRTLERAMAGDTSAIEPAAEQLSRLLAEHPTDPLVMAYAGAATALRADGTWLPWRKLRYADEGLAQIDAALALLTPEHQGLRPDGTPVALETRFVAASTFLSLPGGFGRRKLGERMFADVLASSQLAAAPLSLRGAVWLRAGSAALDDQRVGEARTWLRQVVTSHAPQAPEAHAKLQEIGS